MNLNLHAAVEMFNPLLNAYDNTLANIPLVECAFVFQFRMRALAGELCRKPSLTQYERMR